MNKKIQKSRPQKKSKVVTHEIVVRVQPQPSIQESDLGPVKSGSKYMIPKTWMSEKQVLKIVQKTPPQHVYTRPGKGGQTWSYVTGNYVEKVLNFVFGWNWDFEIVDHGKEADQVWVQGKLTVKDDKGHEITKSQFGRADIKFKKDTKIMLDFGNDLKSASTDALKKCASLLGIASDIYGKMEYKQEAGRDVPATLSPAQAPKIEEESQEAVLKPGQVVGPDGQPTYVCSVCKDPISDAGAEYSMKIFRKRLCKEHADELKNKRK